MADAAEIDRELQERAVEFLGRSLRRAVAMERNRVAWAVVKNCCCVGSTKAKRICEAFGIDPDLHGREALNG